MSTVITLLVTFGLIGGIAFLIDDRLCTSIVAAILKVGRKPSLPVGTKCGAIGGRSFQVRFWWAVGLGAITSYFLCGWFSSSLAGNIGVYVMSVIGILLGFFAGPAFVWVWVRRNNFFKKIDQIEKKEINLGTEAKAAASGLAQNATTAMTGMGHSLVDTITDVADEFTKHLPGHAEVATPEEEPVVETTATADIESTEPVAEAPVAVVEEDALAKARRAIEEYTDGEKNK